MERPDQDRLNLRARAKDTGLIKIAVRVAIELVPSSLTQPNGHGCRLQSTVAEKESFLHQVEHQHAAETYIHLMEAETSELTATGAGA